MKKMIIFVTIGTYVKKYKIYSGDRFRKKSHCVVINVTGN